jgi:dienelactone hydrolase
MGFYERRADIPYGDLPRQSLDVYVPSGGASGRPMVVFWHGGMWAWGSKEQYRFVGAALANSGYVAILPNYRWRPPRCDSRSRRAVSGESRRQFELPMSRTVLRPYC